MENADIIRAGYETFNRGDWSDVPDFFAADAEIDTSVAFIGPVSYRGPHGVQRFMDSIEEQFLEYRARPIELVEAGEHVLVVADLRGRQRVSGRYVEDREIHVWTLREGEIVELRVFRDRAEAERAIGLRERS